MKYQPKEMLRLGAYEADIMEAAATEKAKELHRLCLQDWGLLPGQPYDGPTDGWRHTTSSYWFDRIDAEIEEAAEGGDLIAQDILSLQTGAMAAHDHGLGEAEAMLMEKASELTEAFEPEGIDSLLPRHSCHYFPSFQLEVAKAVFPEEVWSIYTNPLHSFVGSDDGEVFDLLLYADGLSQYHKDAEAGMPDFAEEDAA